MNILKHIKFGLFLFVILLLGCKEDENKIEAEYEAGSNEYINEWIYTNLSNYYYWEEDLPAMNITSEDPESFFYNQLSEKDRFSWIQENFIELINSLQGVTNEAGYEFILFNDPNRSGGVIGQITYIKENSPAAQVTDFKRGDIFDAINGNQITLDNYRSVLQSIYSSHTLRLKRYFATTDTFTDIGDRSFTTAVVEENPILIDSVYEINNKKIGYLVYNLFSVGPTRDSEEYLNDMDLVFSDFKSKGIQHLILDLRYNGGGAESATINLASLIGKGISERDIFVKRDYNDLYENFLIEEYGEDILNKYFIDKAENIGQSLSEPGLVVLTSNRTASASELLINGLDPFMDIYIIGDTTVGKNVGSASIYEENDANNTYGMQPIITKSFNSLNKSDYSNGFIPDFAIRDYGLEKKELGNTEELLLSLALEYLVGSDVVAKSNHLSKKAFNEMVKTSTEMKRSYSIYSIELESKVKDD